MTDLIFGTDSLKDDAAKLTKIYLRVKSGSLSNEEYKHINFYCQLLDITIISFFTRLEGNRRLSVTALLCADISKLYSKINDFPVSIFDMEQIFGRLMAIDEVDWILEDVVTLKMSSSTSRVINITRTGIYIPEELWGLIHRLSMDFGVQFTSFLLYLIRTGVAEYNNFTERFSSKTTDINYEYLKYAKQSEKMFMSAIELRYNDMTNRINYLYNTYKNILDKDHKDLKEVMKKIIDKSNEASA